MPWPRALSFLLLLTLLSPRVASADALRKIERTTSGGSRTRTHGSGSSSSSRGSSSGSSSGSYGSVHYDGGSGSSGCFGTCDQLEALTLVLLAYTLGSPWWVPRLLDDPGLVGYAPYPYADGPGLLRRAGSDAGQEVRKVAVALDVESGWMLQGVVPSGLAMRVMLPGRMELDARFSALSDVRTQPVELASVGTAHVTYRFAQGARYDFRTGVGLRSFALAEARFGFDVMYGVDAYLGAGIVTRIELHLGSAGEALVGQARATVGAMLRRFEVFAGYDHTAYLDPGARTTSLGGPIAGMRAWF